MANRPRSARRVGLLALLAFLSLAGLLLDLLTLGPIVSPAPPAKRLPAAIANTDLNPIGVNIFLDRDIEDWKKRRTMEMIANAGIGWVKQQFSWAEIEPRQGYFWDDRYNRSSWDKFDRIVELAEEYGLQVIARVDRPPDWARAPDSDVRSAPLDPHTYADFLYTFIQHYRGRIHYIQVWNEPNLDIEWHPGLPVNAREYTTLLRLACGRAKEADPDIQILSAPLAIRTSDDPYRLAVSDLTYLEEMYRAGAAPYFDILTANAYGIDDPPEAEPDPGRLNFRRVELQRLIMEKYGDADKAIWFNEYGWNAAPADWPAERLTWGRVTEEQQAAYTVRGIDYARQHWPWAGVISIWYFRQELSPPTVAEYYFRMVNPDFTTMPVFAAVRDYASSLNKATPGWYEETSAPVRRRGDWQPAYSAARSGGAFLESSKPGSYIVVTFWGTDVALRVRRSPDGGRLLVSVDGVSGRGTSLPRNSLGQAYLELYSPTEEWVQVPLIQGLERELPPRYHRLELTVDEEKDAQSQGHLCAIDGFEVDYRRSYLLFWTTAGLAVALLSVLVGLLAAELRRPPPPRLRRPPRNPWTLRPEQVLPQPEEHER